MGNLSAANRILVTGATGFLGGHLVSYLIAEGVSVIAVGRNEPKLEALKTAGCEVLRHDISNSFDQNIDGKIDAIVHCAALSSPFGKRTTFERANIVGTQNVVTLATQHDVKKFIHISTPSIYFSFKDQLDIPETAPLPTPVNHYAHTKLEAEKIVLAENFLDSIILRPRGIYGPGDETLLPRLLRAAAARPLPLLRNGQATIDLTYVGDVVRAIITALDAPPNAVREAFNISGGEVLPIRQIVDACCAFAQIHPRWRKMPLGLAMQAARGIEAISICLPNSPEPMITRYGLGLFAYAQSLNISKAERILGWQPEVTFTDGLARTFGEFR